MKHVGAQDLKKRVGLVSLKRRGVDVLNRVQSKNKAGRFIKLKIFGIREITGLPRSQVLLGSMGCSKIIEVS